ncbi:MAG: patatin-like phospholipase family protein [Spirochaetaceae bacterium]|jgi:NTE family protein|nr:patatin-like phospholipase family protein [Spirochaetaceae bacterium]
MDRKIGIVFGGGGGRGAYQVGVWKAIRDAGLESSFSAVSGCSVGALTAVMFAQGDYESLYEIWSNLKRETVLFPRRNIPSLPKAVKAVDKRMQPRRSLSFGMWSWLGLLETMMRYCDFDKLKSNSTELYTAVTGIMNKRNRPEHLKAFFKFFRNEQFGTPRYITKGELSSAEELYAALIASCAMPGVYPAMLIDGVSCYDGGLWEVHPIQPLADAGYTDILVVTLYDREPANVAAFRQAGCNISVVRPEKSFGSFKDATLDFDGSHFDYKFNLGYADALPVAESMMRSLGK